jgi:hypothetical protein
VLTRILLGALFKKLDLTEFGTKKSDCRFGTFRLLGGGAISSKFDTITIKGFFFFEILEEIPTLLSRIFIAKLESDQLSLYRLAVFVICEL